MTDWLRYWATDIIHDKTGALQVKTGIGSLPAASVNATIIAGVSGKKIRIVSGFISSAATATASWTFLSNAVAVSAAHVLVIGAPMLTLPFNPAGWWEGSSGNNIAATTAGDSLLFTLRYVEVNA